MIWSNVIGWAIPFVCGGLVSLTVSLFVKFKALRIGLQCLLRAEIIRQYEKWTARGYCPLYAKESLTRAYHAYHNLGGNDVATELYEEVMELPLEKEIKNVEQD